MTTSKLLFVLLMSVALTAMGQNYQLPKTEHGLPDLSGVWNFSTQTPFERPEQYGEREFLTEEEVTAIEARRAASAEAASQREMNVAERILNTERATSAGAVNSFWMEGRSLRRNSRTSVVVYPRNGRLPPVQEGVVVQRSDANGVREIPGERPVRYTHGGIDRTGPEDRGLSERCLVFNSGPPLLSGPYNNNLQIIQNDDHVVILTEMGWDARIVPLQKQSALHEKVTLWSGDSRGFFVGNTLVVETTNFTNLIGSFGAREVAYGSAENRLLVERFIPVGPGAMNYEFTIDDPTTFTDIIVGVLPMARVEQGRIYEYACHAGNYAIGNILKGARAAE
ncbi:MAG: hypothetical protein KJN90_03875 [Gammaproteobacteria bacterium]|nr:hypothetical protein [Gammaproteobacteria bacterium]